MVSCASFKFWEVKLQTMQGMKRFRMQPKSLKNPTNQPTFLNTEMYAAEKRNALYWLQSPVQGQGGGKNHKQKPLPAYISGWPAGRILFYN